LRSSSCCSLGRMVVLRPDARNESAFNSRGIPLLPHEQMQHTRAKVDRCQSQKVPKSKGAKVKRCQSQNEGGRTCGCSCFGAPVFVSLSGICSPQICSPRFHLDRSAVHLGLEPRCLF
jgi:hypothetical protein